MASPKFEPWVLWICVCPWLIHAPKRCNYPLTNLLFGLCKSVWIIELLVNLPSPHPGTPTRPSTPEMLRIKERTPTPSPSTIFTFGLVVECTKELGVRHWSCFMKVSSSRSPYKNVIFDVILNDIHVMCNTQFKYCSNGFMLNNRKVGFIIINVITLGLALSY